MKAQDNITKFLIRNSLITYASTAITIVTLVLFFLRSNKAIDESRAYLYYVKSSGEIVPLEWINRRDNIEIEIKHHLQMVVDNFYSLNQFTWEDKVVNKAFWLGDFEKLHAYRESSGYYNKFIQYNVIQEAVLPPENIEVSSIDKENFSFNIIVNITMNAKKYVLFARGKIKVTDRNFPYNPHGLWVYDYIEDQLTEVEEK